MKKLLLSLVMVSFVALAAQAQRYAVVDSHYILEKMPEYNQAQDDLDKIADDWQKEIDAKFKKVQELYQNYSAEKVVLSDDLKKKREDEIMDLEKQAQELQNKRFGFEGDLFEKREELIKPIQDKVYNAVQQLAAQKLYDIILDKSEGVTVFYADPKLDKSDDVLKILGLNK